MSIMSPVYEFSDSHAHALPYLSREGEKEGGNGIAGRTGERENGRKSGGEGHIAISEWTWGPRCSLHRGRSRKSPLRSRDAILRLGAKPKPRPKQADSAQMQTAGHGNVMVRWEGGRVASW